MGMIAVIKQHKTHFFWLALLFLALLLRFYGFLHYWEIAPDEAHDVLLAQEAIHRGEWPPTSSFTSAGPFVFGPYFYWFIKVSYLIFPSWLQAPWFFAALIGGFTVMVLAYAGRLLAGNRLGLLVGLLAATSPQLVMRSRGLTQHTLVATVAALLLVFYILLWKKHKFLYALLLGISLGLAVNLHYQALNLLAFIPAIFLVKTISLKSRLAAVLLAGVGFLLPAIPLLSWDAQQHWANLNNLLDYFTVGQYRIYVPNSWRLYLGNFLPSYLAYEVGGTRLVAVILMIISPVFISFAFLKQKLSAPVLSLVMLTGFILVINRFYRGERFLGYFLYFSPLLLLTIGFVLLQLFNVSKAKILQPFSARRRLVNLVGAVVLAGITWGNLQTIKFHLPTPPTQANQTVAAVKAWRENKPGTYKLFRNVSADQVTSNRLAVVLNHYKLLAKDGEPIGVCRDCPAKSQVFTSVLGHQVVGLDQVDQKELATKWTNNNPDVVYDDLLGWLLQHKLTSNYTFSLPGFIYGIIIHLK